MAGKLRLFFATCIMCCFSSFNKANRVWLTTLSLVKDVLCGYQSCRGEIIMQGSKNFQAHLSGLARNWKDAYNSCDRGTKCTICSFSRLFWNTLISLTQNWLKPNVRTSFTVSTNAFDTQCKWNCHSTGLCEEEFLNKSMFFSFCSKPFVLYFASWETGRF